MNKSIIDNLKHFALKRISTSEMEELNTLSNVVIIDGVLYKCLINANKGAVRLEETAGEIILIIDDFQLARQKSFSVLTKKNNKNILEEHSLAELTPNIANKFSNFIDLIIDEYKRTGKSNVSLNLEEIKETLMLDKKRATSQLKYFLTILQLTLVKSINANATLLKSYSLDIKANKIEILVNEFALNLKGDK